MTRAEKVARAQQLRGGGLLVREIAERMGVAKSTVDSWLNDPDGSRLKARKQSYAGECVECGAPTNGSDGHAKAPKRCSECSHRYQHEQARWTPETVVAAIRRFAAEHGRPPAATAWFRPVGVRGAEYPSTNTVLNVCGSWSAAIAAAGFTPRRPGYYGRVGEDIEVCREIRDRYEAGESSCVLAAEYGCASGTIRQRILSAGGSLRPPGTYDRRVAA